MNGVCDSCGKVCSHEFEDWHPNEEATCVTEGEEVRLCEICVYEEIRTIPATGEHNYEIPEGAGEKYTTTAEYTDGTNTAVIPAGFTVSGAGGTCTVCGAKTTTIENVIDEGLVIYLIDDKTESEIAAIDWNNATTLATLQQTYDQFVWIPVEDINDMYMCQSEDGTKSCKITVSNGVATCTTHNSTAMAGRLYATGTGENFNAELTTHTYEGLHEPGVYTSSYSNSYDNGTYYLNMLNEILGTSYSSSSDLKTDLQSEYNEIVKSVYENGGFYVGRYETSNIRQTDGITVRVVAGQRLYVGSANWYYAYAQQKDYASNKELTSVGSSMIQGAAYDQVMKFVDGAIDGNGNTYSVTTYNYERHSGGSSNANTGADLDDKVKNIYDLEGNVYAFTTEVSTLSGRCCRGGTYGYCYSASYRKLRTTTAEVYVGSVSQLYVK